MDSDNEYCKTHSENTPVVDTSKLPQKDKYVETRAVNPYSRYVCYGLIGEPNRNIVGYGDDI